VSDGAILALDIGTSSVRASIYSRRLRMLRLEQAPYAWRESGDGRVEIDAARLERLIAAVIDRALAGWRRPISAVCAATFWHSLLGVDASYRPVTPLVPWSDRRAEEESIRLRGDLNERQVHARTGCRFHASYWPARLAWFRRHQPGVMGRVRRWVTFGEWLERQWLGREAVSMSQASGSGVFDQDRCVWDAHLLGGLGVDPHSLAPIIDVDDRSGDLRAALRRRWPALAGAPWIPALGDGALNTVGAGCVTRRRAALMIGTSGAMRVLWEPSRGERVRPSFGLWRYRLDARRVIVGGALSNGGNVREWMMRMLGGAADGTNLEKRAASLAPDSHGLTVLPFLAGTRSPDYEPHATGVVSGITIATRPEEILRATLESVAYRFAAIDRELRLTLHPREIVAAGGALEQGRAWGQIVADVLGRPLTVCRERELTSRGVAAVALEQLGLMTLSELTPPAGRVIEPDARRHRIYAAARVRQERMWALWRRKLMPGSPKG
jgi:gluconokinase